MYRKSDKALEKEAPGCGVGWSGVEWVLEFFLSLAVGGWVDRIRGGKEWDGLC